MVFSILLSLHPRNSKSAPGYGSIRPPCLAILSAPWLGWAGLGPGLAWPRAFGVEPSTVKLSLLEELAKSQPGRLHQTTAVPAAPYFKVILLRQYLIRACTCAAAKATETLRRAVLLYVYLSACESNKEGMWTAVTYAVLHMKTAYANKDHIVLYTVIKAERHIPAQRRGAMASAALLANWARTRPMIIITARPPGNSPCPGLSALSPQLQVIHTPTWYMIRFPISTLSLVPQT